MIFNQMDNILFVVGLGCFIVALQHSWLGNQTESGTPAGIATQSPPFPRAAGGNSLPPAAGNQVPHSTSSGNRSVRAVRDHPPGPPSADEAAETSPVLLHLVPALLTRQSVAAHYRPRASVSFVIDSNGAPTGITLTLPLPYGLDETVREAVSQWRYRPATRRGKPVPYRTLATVPFSERIK